MYTLFAIIMIVAFLWLLFGTPGRPRYPRRR